MKKIFSLFAALVLAMGAFAAGEVVYSLDAMSYCGQGKGYNSDYTAYAILTVNSMTWKIGANLATDNGGFRFGGKNIPTGADREMYNQTPMASPVDSFVLSHKGVTSTSLTVNKLKLLVASDSLFTTIVDSVVINAPTLAKATEGSIKFAGASAFPANSYYKLVVTITNSVNSNYAFTVTGLDFYYGGEGAETAVTGLHGTLTGVDPEVTYAFDPKFTYNADSTLTINGTLNAEAAAVVGMVPQAFINNAYAGNFNMTASTGACTFTTSAKFGNSETITFALYMAYAGGATRSADTTYTTPAYVAPDTTATVHIANTAATAYTTAEAIALINDKKSILTDSVYVIGVVGDNNPTFNSQYKSITYYLDHNAFQIYSGRGLGNTDFADVNGVGLNDTVVVKGVIKLFSGKYEMDKNNYLVELRQYVKPATDTTATVSIANTLETAYTVSEALALLADKKSILTDSVYVSGVADSIIEVTAKFGNATFMMTDGENSIKVFRVKDLGNQKFTSDNAVKVGDKMVVKTVLAEYNSEKECNGGYFVDFTHYGYFIKHPWGTGANADWAWKEMSDTTFMDVEASYYIGLWGNNGFNIALDSKYTDPKWYDKDLIGYINAEGTPGDVYAPKALGEKVVFVYLHEPLQTVVGGGQAWVVTGMFTALDENGAEVTLMKVMIDGQIYIIRGEHMFNVNGVMVK